MHAEMTIAPIGSMTIASFLIFPCKAFEARKSKYFLMDFL
jgi:hypothetical protein